jgi:polar amino acid transport system substrate-binding protein
MRYFLMFFLLLFSYFTSAISPNSAQNVINIKVVTEDTFPLQYVVNNKVAGPATELVEQVLSAAEVNYSIEVLPWARAYHLALTEPNILIYSLAKTAMRADKFKWVGRIIALDYYLYGSADSNINSQTTLDELKKYRIGTVRDSAVFQYLQKNGFNQLTTVVKGRQNVLLFQQNRIDFFPANKSSFQAICQQDSFNCNGLQPIYKLDVSAVDLYIAFSSLTDDTIVKKVRVAYKQVMEKRKILHDIGIN